MNKGFTTFLLTFLLPLFTLGQSKVCNCNGIKTGTFYLYPLNSQKSFIIIRDKSIQKEINIEAKDTSFWKVNWQSNCILNLKFIRKNQPLSDEDKFFYSHNIVVKVLNVTKDYYTFKGGLDSVNNTSALTDTLWFTARPNH